MTTLLLTLAVASKMFEEKRNRSLADHYRSRIWRTYTNSTGDLQQDFILSLHAEDDTVFRQLLESGRTITNQTTVAQKNLLAAYDAIRDFLEDIDDLKAFMKFLVEQVVVVRTIAENQSTAFLIFETLNERGTQGLEPEDLLKNELLKRIDPDEIDKQLVPAWNTFVETLMDTKRGRYVVALSTFLKHYIMSYGTYVTKSRIFDYFRGQTFDAKAAKTELEALRQNATAYRRFIDNHPNRSVKALKTLRFRQAYIVMLAASDLAVDQFEMVAEAAENVALAYVFTGGKTSVLEKEFAAVAGLLRGSRGDGSDITGALKRLRKLASDKRGMLAASLKDFRADGPSSEAKAAYLLKRLASSLEQGSFDSYHLEHVLPQSPSSGWSNSFPEDAVYRLGNLTLLSKADNSSVGNQSFGEKARVYAESCRLTKSIVKPLATGTKKTKFDRAIAAFEPVSTKTWTTEAINARTRALAQLTEYILFGQHAKD